MNITISGLPAMSGTAPDMSSVLPIVDTSTKETKKITLEQLAKALADSRYNGSYLPLNGSAVNGVAASGVDYVRFGDGTQICWGDTPALPEIPEKTTVDVLVTFAQAFKDTAYSIVLSPGKDGGNTWLQRVYKTDKRNTSVTVGIGNESYTVPAGGTYRYIAIGRWK